MSGLPRPSRVVPLALIAIGLSLAARADTETHRRVTIKGTGSDISVERTETLTAPAQKPELSRAASTSPVLSEAIRMKQSGRPDEAVLAYLRSHASQLPVVVDLDTATNLRRAGAGKPVLAYLASVAAIEIGDSGAPWGPPLAEASAPPEYEPGPAAEYGYPVVGGYSAPGGTGRFGSHPFHRPTGEHRVPMGMRPAPARALPPPAPLERHVVFGSR